MPTDNMSRIIQRLERVGYVSVQSYTREELKVVKGGLLTHLFLSGFLGPADLNQDGILDFGELKAWLQSYAGDQAATRTQVYLRVKVQAPREGRRAPEVVDLRRLGNTGLVFTGVTGETPVCYWIRDSRGDLVAEVCKPARETRRIHLPPGSYRVQQFSPPDALTGREGDVQIRDTFQRVQDENLTAWWQWWDRLKGAPPADPVLEARGPVRALTEDEVAYRERSPVLHESVTWTALAGRQRWGLRLGSSLPLRPLGQEVSLETAAEDSLTQERPFGTLTAVVDRRLSLLPGGYTTLGGELELGGSPLNAVGSSARDVLVTRLRYHVRLGLEGDWRSGRGRLVACLGGFSAFPFRPEDPFTSSASGGDLSRYSLLLGLTGGLEVGAAWKLPSGQQLESGLRPEVAVEFQDVGRAVAAPFLGLSAFVGVRWP